MSGLSLFLKKNKKVKENVFYAPTKSLCDETGKPLEWEIKHLTTKEDEEIRDGCTMEVQVTGKPNLYRPKLDSGKYLAKMIAASVVEPNLYNAELQDSYGVRTPEELIKEMVDEPGEYQDFATFVQKMVGYNMEEKVKEAKN